MATAFYYAAAHFNMPSAHANDFLAPSASPIDMVPANTLYKPIYQHQSILRSGFTSGQEASPLFRLPAELRNQIYELLLCPGTPSRKQLSTYVSTISKSESVYPAILSTCRKIFDEAKDLPYTRHIFHAHPSLLTSFPHLVSLSKPIVNADTISKINRWQLTLRLDTDPRFTTAQATTAFSGAEYLEIKVWQSMFDGCDSSVLRLFTGIRGVRVARVSGSADPELARWLEQRMKRPLSAEGEEGICECAEERELRCGKCCKRIDAGMQWWQGRNPWAAGNR